jgi:hypothetical protein
MYLQVDLFGEHQPVDKHGNPLKIGDEVKLNNGSTFGTIVGYEVNALVRIGETEFDYQFDLLEKLNND